MIGLADRPACPALGALGALGPASGPRPPAACTVGLRGTHATSDSFSQLQHGQLEKAVQARSLRCW